MYTTEVFIYTERQIVVLPTGLSSRSFMPVYSKVLTLNKGVDNSIQFQFLNQQQKPVDITGIELTFRILNAGATKVLFAKSLQILYALTGIASLEVGEAELSDLDSQRCYYTIEYTRNSGNNAYAVFMDQLSGARGDLVIADSVMPKFIPCMEVTIPSDQLTPNNEMYMNQCAMLGIQAQALTYYSSTVSTYDNYCITFQASYLNYSGNVIVEGAVTNDDTSWYPITIAEEHSSSTDTKAYTIEGYHPYMRLKFTSWAGSVENILVR